MQRRRLLAVLLVGAAGLGGLAGCRTSPNVAAYVGDEQVTVAELDDAVAERLADPDIAAYAEADRTGFTRQVLSLQVGEEVYAAVARRYDVEVTDAEVRDRLAELLGDNDPDAVYAQVAQQQGANRDDVFENVRQQLVRQRVAVAEGEADLSDAALRARYDESADELTQTELGIITVPDQPTADGVLAQLTADPGTYPALATQFAGGNTLPAVEPFAGADVPEVLAEQVAGTAAGQGFTRAVPEAGGVVVGFVRAVTVPAFADVRDQLAEQAAGEAEEAGAARVTAVRDDLDLDVNPRYGVLDEDRVVAGEGGVVQLLEDAGGAGAADAGAGAAGD
ncbi:peptidylprolyl isomerase [Modestobacter versicolor]|uniref:Peptidyl-prolyl cis-trans isomerase SurA n=1 Tax=Modestobacter versicolor TaxID=429133 RepID=A0A839Y1B4_9ACTN|nr:peptidylprolyl isomerase [Modestobacter versicolor]MBB3676575.1 peptidyl-prolyl cis-trans isomerase SurA [Modestobacter versicolor]